MPEINLADGSKTLVDDCDFENLSGYAWYIKPDSKNYLSVCRSKWDGTRPRQIVMSRQIMGVADPKIYVDHINGNTLDNRRVNLRLATHGQNRANSKCTTNSGYKGVTYRPRPGRRKHYEVHIRKDGKTRYFGAYYTAEEAALVYNREVVKLHGEFVRLNKVK